MRVDPKSVDKGINIVGAESSGIDKSVVLRVGEKIEEDFRSNGKEVRLKGMRFIPSTKVNVGFDAFQVIANSVFEVVGYKGRPEIVESVVTVDGKALNKQVLRAVKTPSLKRS